MRSPIYIRYPNGEKRVVEQLFEHPDGVLYFELFWENDPAYSIHLIAGDINGEGPWKVGECTFHVLGCNHTHPQLCELHSFWQHEVLMHPEKFRTEDIVTIALEKGAILSNNNSANDARYQS